ncbi:MAG: hypothetical protein DME32_17605 [Verrucomicrobia bacterium]|nr:MAG: hypothetical protein DME32_17605 [Verrucomicrobiota bacterium]
MPPYGALRLYARERAISIKPAHVESKAPDDWISLANYPDFTDRGAQAASLQFSAACRKHLQPLVIDRTTLSGKLPDTAG